MRGPDHCRTCGAKVRGGRERCLRCGASMTSTAAEPGRSAAIRLTPRHIVFVAAGACLLLTAAAVQVRGGPSSVPVEGRPEVAGAPIPGRDVAVASAAAASQPVARVDSAVDESRAAVSSYGRGDIGGAIEQLTAVVEANPGDAAALNNLGQALVRNGRAADAIPYFDRAVERSPATWAYHFNRARAFAELRAWSQAIAGYRQAAALFPEDYATQFNLARALQESGDLQAAIESFQKAVTLAPGQPAFLLSLGGAQEAANRPADAAGSYKRYLELEPGSSEADKIRERIARLTS